MSGTPVSLARNSIGHNIEFAWLLTRAEASLGWQSSWQRLDAYIEHALRDSNEEQLWRVTCGCRKSRFEWEAIRGPPSNESYAVSFTRGRLPDLGFSCVNYGQTIALRSGQRVRLVQIDTPEVFFGTECYGRQASQTTKRLLLVGSEVRLFTKSATVIAEGDATSCKRIGNSQSSLAPR